MASPLADRLRPTDIDSVAGQQHLLGKGKVLRRIIDSGEIPNLIFYGPSGVGKTTVANIIAKQTNRTLYQLNATTASTADIKNIVIPSTVKEIVTFDGNLERAVAGQAVTLTLNDEIDISRGNVLIRADQAVPNISRSVHITSP